jgi:Protein of unknown function (DUF1592)/Protein of unknown function (DUF1588)/Protein of unknown function (DUF1595)/Protein of unknown function (DUF1585)/Protein of unknown function (DUF1587)
MNCSTGSRFSTGTVIAALLAGLAGCQGTIADGSHSPEGTSPDEPPPEENVGITPEESEELEQGGCTAIDAEPGELHRLTRTEYQNTVRDLLGLRTAPVVALPKDITDSNGFAGGEAITAALAETLSNESEKLAYQAITDRPEWGNCAGSDERTCARIFVEIFVGRAYRRPVTDAERDRHLVLFDAVRKRETYKDAVAAIISAAIQSPNFLFRVESGEPIEGNPDLRRLSPWQTAARMSYALWQTMPDEALAARAKNGALDNPEERRMQAERLLGDPRARDVVKSFHESWLSLESVSTTPPKVPTVIAKFDVGLRTSMRESTRAFVDQVFWNGDGSVKDLMLSSHKFVDTNLAPIYGIPAPAGGKMTGMPMPADKRPGLLTEPSILTMLAYTDQTNPIKRGEFVRTNLLCQELPEPPANVDLNVPAPSPGVSTRERFDAHRTDPTCAACHTLLDPVGLGLDAYDAVGRIRTVDEGGSPVDDAGTLSDVEKVGGDFKGAGGLAQKLADSPEVERCVVKQWFRYVSGHHEGARDLCTVQAGVKALLENNGRMASVIPALMASPGFVRKRLR